MPRGKQLYGIFNWRTAKSLDYDCDRVGEAKGGMCLLDGEDVSSQCCYIDTSGTIKTFDLRGANVPTNLADGKPHTIEEWPVSMAWPVDLEDSNGIIVRVRFGAVELYAPYTATGPCEASKG